ncbi:hypothetical protein DXG01_004586 [Tephrocybe rancida]|nr:hypothetical protein DXG01_004586 [Tephrocybe rancida]
MRFRENYYYPEDPLNPLWSYIVSTIILSTTAFVVHILLTYRIYRLMDCNKIIGGFIVLLTLASWAVGICTTVTVTGLGRLAKAESLKILLTFWLSFDVALDLFIALTLIILLLRSRSGFQKSNSVINRLVRAALQTGFLVAIFTMTSLILYLKYPTSQYYGILGLPAGRVYSASIMDTLLVRHSLREKVKGGRTPTGAIWQLEDLGWLPGTKTPAKGPAEFRFPVMAMES